MSLLLLIVFTTYILLSAEHKDILVGTLHLIPLTCYGLNTLETGLKVVQAYGVAFKLLFIRLQFFVFLIKPHRQHHQRTHTVLIDYTDENL